MRPTLSVLEPALVDRVIDSGVGVTYADQDLKQLKQTLPDGRGIAARRCARQRPGSFAGRA